MGKNHDHSHEHCGHDHGHHGHGHHHHHGHSHGPANYNMAFAVGITLNLIFVATEATYGYLANSLALMADAGHNLSDVLGLVLAWGATWLAKKKPTRHFTYGLRSSSILAALANALFLLIALGGIVWEALHRLNHPEPVSGSTVIAVAAVGIVINAATAALFMSGRKSDLNIRGAYLHMAADALVSAGVVIAGVIISYTGWQALDPIVSLVVSVIILYGTWDLLRESVKLAIAAVPTGIDPHAVSDFLGSCANVKAVHDLHIWGMSTTETALTVHLVMPTGHPGDEFLIQISDELQKRFQIGHTTIQIEIGNSVVCKLEPDHVV
jgi:cobalt-zinc-cadmium efflux system protein